MHFVIVTVEYSDLVNCQLILDELEVLNLKKVGALSNNHKEVFLGF